MKSMAGIILMMALLLGFAACGRQQPQAPQGQGTLPGGTTSQTQAPTTTPSAGTTSPEGR